MSVIHIENTVIVVVGVKVVRCSIGVEVARPGELVNAPVVVIVLVVSASSCAIAVLVGHAIVVVVHRVLVSEIEVADGPDVGVGVINRRVEVAIGGNVPRVEALCFEGIVIDWSLKDAIVVIVPVVDVKDTVVVMVVRVGAVASIESLEQVVDSVVVVIKVVKVVDAVVVVVACTCFFKEGGIRRYGCLQDRKVNDDT